MRRVASIPSTPRHADVHHDHVRTEVAGELDRLLAFRNGADDLDLLLGLEHGANHLREGQVVVGDQDSHRQLALTRVESAHVS